MSFKKWFSDQEENAIEEMGEMPEYHDNLVLEAMCESAWNYQQYKIEKLQAENKIMREALEFYACPTHWHDKNKFKKRNDWSCFDYYSEPCGENDAEYKQGGKLARKTLKELGE